MNERATCPRCGAEYDVLDEAASEAMGGLCAACWYSRRERDIGEGREREAGRTDSNVDRKLVSSD
jgi:NMD protein affecting ribosome stability and mRNA decay